ncbi:MAG: DMT family transporter, partial [Bdellovibrionota bacterium]
MLRLWNKVSGNGPLVMLAATLVFPWMGLGVAAAAPLPPAEITFFRFALSLPLMGLLHRGGVLHVQFNNRRLLFLRGTYAGVAVLCYFAAISKIGAGRATLFNNCYPFFAFLSAVYVGQEEFHTKSALLLLVALSGLLLIVAPGVGAVEWGWGPALGLLSASFAGAGFVVIRDLRKTDEAPAIYTAMCVVGMLLALPFALPVFTWPTLHQWGWLGIITVCSTAAQLLMNHALRYLSATAGSILSALTTAFTALFAFLFFGEHYQTSFFVGAGLIFGAAAFIAKESHKDPAFGG